MTGYSGLFLSTYSVNKWPVKIVIDFLSEANQQECIDAREPIHRLRATRTNHRQCRYSISRRQDTGNLQRRSGVSRPAMTQFLCNFSVVLLEVQTNKAQPLRHTQLFSLSPHLGLVQSARKTNEILQNNRRRKTNAGRLLCSCKTAGAAKIKIRFYSNNVQTQGAAPIDQFTVATQLDQFARFGGGSSFGIIEVQKRARQPLTIVFISDDQAKHFLDELNKPNAPTPTGCTRARKSGLRAFHSHKQKPINIDDRPVSLSRTTA